MSRKAIRFFHFTLLHIRAMFSGRFLATAMCWWLALQPALVRGADQSADVLTLKSATIGFGGKFKAGFWQPVWLTLVAGSAGARGQLELVVADGDQTPAVFFDAERGSIDLSVGSERTILLYCKSGPATAAITARLVDGNRVVWSQELEGSRPLLHSTQEFIVGLGAPAGLEDAVATIRRQAETKLAVSLVASGAQLPDRWFGYDGVDQLFITTSEKTLLDSLIAEQQQAIVDWVLLGGRLILCSGRNGEALTGTTNAFSKLIPGEFVEIESLRDRSGLEGFTKSELPFDDPTFQRNRPYVTRLKSTRGEVLLDEISSASGRPLAIHAPAGLGQITFVAFDLDHPAFESWKGRSRLVAALLQASSSNRESTGRPAHSGIKQLGYEDLIGQLRVALDQFGGVSLVNFTSVSVLTLIYLLIIGPGDYFFLSRLNLPRQITWFTFPVVAAGMIGLTAALGSQFHGRQTRLNQVEIIDIDLNQQLVRGTAWFNLYSPTTTRFDVSFGVSPPDLKSKPFEGGWLSWQGLPGDALGGLESHQPALALRHEYSVSSPTQKHYPQIRSLILEAASSKALSARWWAKTALPAATKLSIDRFGLLAGEFQQPLDIPLTECLLVHGEKLYRLGTLAPGQRVVIAEQAPLNLEARLTQRRVEQTKDISTPWEQDSVDIPRIMQMLMFHEAARGSNYTGLTHRYQPQIDLSEHMRLGQAVLVGRAERAVSQLDDVSSLLDSKLFDNSSVIGTVLPASIAFDHTTHWTYFRIIMGVNAIPESRTPSPEPPPSRP
jgi:hypothetical protein